MRKLSRLLTLLRKHSLSRSFGLLAIIFVFSPTWLAAQTPLPTPKHIVIVIEENHSFKQIINNKDAPYMNKLAREGASFTSFFALHHPSQPNYIVLFSGDRQKVKNNKCPKRLNVPSLGGELIKKQLTAPGPDGKMTRSFKGYAEGLPSPDPTACEPNPKPYARKHVPWVNFYDVPSDLSFPLTAFPQDPKGFEGLPTVSVVIPNLDNDMHDGSINQADTWLMDNISRYVEWAKDNDSLLIITWDEGNSKAFLWFNRTTKPPRNRIPTIFVGEMVQAGKVSNTEYTHLDLLRTIEEMYGLPLLGKSQNAKVINDIWK